MWRRADDHPRFQPIDEPKLEYASRAACHSAGVLEWRKFIDRDTGHPEVFALSAQAGVTRYNAAPPDAQGWLCSKATNVRLSRTAGDRLVMQLDDNVTTRRELPDEQVR